jgi:hemoglobin-like flavoprotein
MQEESFYEHPAFVRHAVAVVRMLDVAVHMLGPDLDPVTEALEGLGARHVQYGVIPDHYPIVGEALLSTLEAALGDAWTDKVKLGWTTIFSFVSSTMIKGAIAATGRESSSSWSLNATTSVAVEGAYTR